VPHAAYAEANEQTRSHHETDDNGQPRFVTDYPLSDLQIQPWEQSAVEAAQQLFEAHQERGYCKKSDTFNWVSPATGFAQSRPAPWITAEQWLNKPISGT